MGGTSQTLTLDEVVAINRRQIRDHGGIFFDGDNNLANRGSLEHALVEIHGTLFGQELYPSVIEKAAVLGWRIIINHIFHDGNKRTGMETVRLFLALNDLDMRIAPNEEIDQDVVQSAIDVAKGEMGLEAFTVWLQARAKPTH
jgi:death on curing protein